MWLVCQTAEDVVWKGIHTESPLIHGHSYREKGRPCVQPTLNGNEVQTPHNFDMVLSAAEG